MFCVIFTFFFKLIAILSVVSDAVHNQVMRHNFFIKVFNRVYINNSVQFNVQDTFLKNDISDDELTWAFTHMSIQCNLRALKKIFKEVMKSLLTVNSDIAGLKHRFKEQYTQIK